jgi:hypothetical protein
MAYISIVINQETYIIIIILSILIMGFGIHGKISGNRESS